MAEGPLEPVSYIGERLRSWRDEKNLNGPEVCTAASRLANRRLVWKQLRAYELGHALPDIDTAAAIARALDRDLVRLLVPETVASQSRQPVSIHSLPDLRAVLRDNDSAEDLAEEFAGLGVNAGLLRRWLNAVPAAVALGYLGAGVDRNVAQRWHGTGVTPVVAIALASAGFEPESPRVSSFTDGEDAGHLLVQALRIRLDLPVDDPTPRTPASLDSLESIPWELWGFSVDEAKRWVDAGLMPVRAKYVSATFTPEEAALWTKTDISAKDWESWRAVGWSAADAGRLASDGFTAESSTPWRSTGLDVDGILMLHSADLTHETATEWQGTGASPAEIRGWHAGGLMPRHYRKWAPVGARPQEVLAWMLARVDVEEARRWTAAGVPTAGQRQQWIEYGFGPTEAANWGIVGPGRARDLIGRGVSLQHVRRRRRDGIEALHAARAVLAGRLSRSGASGLTQSSDRRTAHATGEPPKDSAQPWFRPTQLRVEVCDACGQPVRDGTRCGC